MVLRNFRLSDLGVILTSLWVSAGENSLTVASRFASGTVCGRSASFYWEVAQAHRLYFAASEEFRGGLPCVYWRPPRCLCHRPRPPEQGARLEQFLQLKGSVLLLTVVVLFLLWFASG